MSISVFLKNSIDILSNHDNVNIGEAYSLFNIKKAGQSQKLTQIFCQVYWAFIYNPSDLAHTFTFCWGVAHLSIAIKKPLSYAGCAAIYNKTWRSLRCPLSSFWPVIKLWPSFFTIAPIWLYALWWPPVVIRFIIVPLTYQSILSPHP